MTEGELKERTKQDRFAGDQGGRGAAADEGCRRDRQATAAFGNECWSQLSRSLPWKISSRLDGEARDRGGGSR